MTRETIKFLWDILHDDSIHGDEVIALRNLLKKESSLEIDSKGLFDKSEGAVAPEPEYKTLLDYRIKKMSLDDFRTFPHREGKPYGIDFCNAKDEVNSLLLIGNNGTGKSSIFTALEKAYTGFASQADERQVKQDLYTSYGLKNKSKDELNQSVHVSLVDERGRDDYSNITTSASFCSSFDIQQIEQSGDDLTDYILQQLGYGEILEIEKMLAYVKSMLFLERENLNKSLTMTDSLSSEIYMEVITEFIEVVYRKDNEEPLNIEGEEKFKDIEKIGSLIEGGTDQPFDNLLFAKYWKSISELYENFRQSEQSTTGIPSMSADQSLMQEIEKQEYILSCMFTTFFTAYNNYKMNGEANKVLTELYASYNKAKIREESSIMSIGAAEEKRTENEKRDKAITSIQSLIITKKESIVNDFVLYARPFIERILSNFAEPDETFKIKSKNGLKVNIHVSQNGNTPFIAKPNEYLNSFRFVLFCVTLKVALSLWQMKKKKMVTPIVIDDVFDVSDFENCLKLEEFFYWLICSYKETALSSKISIPMQLILLTHDEMMKASFERALQRARRMEALDAKTKRRITSQVIYGRLAKYQFAEQIEAKGMNKGVLSEQNDILNLYYVL